MRGAASPHTEHVLDSLWIPTLYFSFVLGGQLQKARQHNKS